MNLLELGKHLLAKSVDKEVGPLPMEIVAKDSLGREERYPVKVTFRDTTIDETSDSFKPPQK